MAALCPDGRFIHVELGEPSRLESVAGLRGRAGNSRAVCAADPVSGGDLVRAAGGARSRGIRVPIASRRRPNSFAVVSQEGSYCALLCSFDRSALDGWETPGPPRT